MKLYFKTFVAFLMMGLALVSCNDKFDEDEARVSYPEKVDLGIWENEYTTEGGMAYTINLTLNEKGDTICDITMFNTATEDANVLSAGKFSYDKATGIISASYENSPWETPALATLTFKNDLQNFTVNLYSVNNGKLASKGLFTGVQTNTISVLGDWALANGTSVSLAPDFSAIVSVGEKGEQATYTWDDVNCVITTKSGKTISMKLNERGQMFADGNVYAQHIMTQPKNDWYEYAAGHYENALFGSLEGRVLEYSPSRRMARIAGFSPIETSAPLTFYWNIGEMTVTHAEKSYDTGYDHVQDGQMFGRVFAVPVAITEDGRTAIFDAENNMFIFGHKYDIPEVGASFGAAQEAFIIEKIFE